MIIDSKIERRDCPSYFETSNYKALNSKLDKGPRLGGQGAALKDNPPALFKLRWVRKTKDLCKSLVANAAGNR